MDTLRIVNKLERIQNLTAKQKRDTAVAFNNSTAVLGCITDYLESEITKLDKQLENPDELYSSNKSDAYVAFLLAERAGHLKTLRLLTEKTEVLDCDQQKDI